MFTFSPLHWEPVEGKKDCRRLTADRAVYLNGKLLAVIPLGTISNGMSFPWYAKLIWKDVWAKKYEDAAWLHDHHCDQLKAGTCPFKKRFVDWLFEGILLHSDVSSLEAWIFKNAVRTKR